MIRIIDMARRRVDGEIGKIRSSERTTVVGSDFGKGVRRDRKHCTTTRTHASMSILLTAIQYDTETQK